jgi:diguanylate cyclase (GGDEF)-like protein/PAS domain S-box-containing protein
MTATRKRSEAGGPLAAVEFQRRFMFFILLAWSIPPVFGLSFLIFIGMFGVTQMTVIMTTPLEPVFVLGSLAFALGYFKVYIKPVRDYLKDSGSVDADALLRRVRRFPLDFWAMFLGYLLLAPASVIVSAERYTGFIPQPSDWLRIHLVALIVSIIVGLPIFFLILDLFGLALGGVPLRRPHLTIKTKVFLIGALVPLLIDTMLVQYYWTRTGFFTAETFVMWLLLELLAIGGSLIFVRSFGQSLRPLQRMIGPAMAATRQDYPALVAQSTDELGVLTHDFRELLQQLQEGEANLRALAENANDGILVLQDGRQVFANRRLARMLGYQPGTLRDATLRDLVYPDELERVEDIRVRLSRGESAPQQYETRFVKQDGTGIDVEVTAAMTLWRGEPANLVVVRDITERKQAEDALFQEKERAQVTLDSIGDAVITTDARGRVTYLNPVAIELTGWSNDDAQGRPLPEVFAIINEETREPMESPVNKVLRDGEIVGLANHTTLIRRDRQEFAIDDSAAPIRDRAGNTIGVVLVFHDVSQARALSREVAYQASHDALTGLINRREFEVRLRQALETTRNEGKQHAVCYLDLDQFKVVNDTCGHLAGDELLRQLALHLRAGLRDGDAVARLGGDEFGVILESCPLDRARVIANELRQVVSAFRFAWEERTFEIGVSIGLVLVTAESGELSDVLRAADAACYVAKDLGRNRVHVYQADDLALTRRHGEMQWIARINQAFEESRFELYVQPIVPLSAAANSPPLYELLIRLRDEKGDIVSPAAFLPAAERYNMMPGIDRWVIRTAFRHLREGRLLAQQDGSRISINISGQSLSDEQFLEFVVDQLTRNGVRAGRICFEVTETAAIANLARATQFISVLKDLGCVFALDDFGSGLSSFAYLKRLPVDFLKIDGGFVRDMLRESIDHSMVEAINQLGHVIGIQTIAEFVESDAILERLRTLGVDYAQGFGIGRPMPIPASGSAAT